jgi:hypothetical protein
MDEAAASNPAVTATVGTSARSGRGTPPAGIADAAALDAVVAVGQAEMDGQGLMRLVGSW